MELTRVGGHVSRSLILSGRVDQGRLGTFRLTSATRTWSGSGTRSGGWFIDLQIQHRDWPPTTCTEAPCCRSSSHPGKSHLYRHDISDGQDLVAHVDYYLDIHNRIRPNEELNLHPPLHANAELIYDADPAGTVQDS
jgi:hypothetical protein